MQAAWLRAYLPSSLVAPRPRAPARPAPGWLRPGRLSFLVTTLEHPALGRDRVRVGAAAAVALGALLLVAAIAHQLEVSLAPAAPPIRATTVTRGSVQVAVSGTGTLVPIQQQALDFPEPGKLTEVDVKVGDHVTAGQILARIDPTPYQGSLRADQAALVAAQAGLANASSPAVLKAAQDGLAAAQTELTDSQNQARAISAADASALAGAQRQLTVDSSLPAKDQAAQRAACASGGSGSGPSGSGGSGSRPSGPGGSASSSGASGPASSGSPATGSPGSGGSGSATSSLVRSGTGGASGPGSAGPGGSGSGTGAPASGNHASGSRAASPACAQAGTVVNADHARIVTDQAAVAAARSRQTADAASNQTLIAQAQAAVTNAQDALNTENATRPNDVASQQAAATAAAALLQTAQTSLTDTVLTAPFDGTVASLNGAVGELVGAAGGAPAAPAGASGPAPGPGPGAIPSSAPFILLSDLSAFQVVTPLAEADAAQVRPGQDVSVTLNALPGLRVPGKVLALAPLASVIRNLPDFLMTVALDVSDPRLRAGMTALTAVVVGVVNDVLTVPNAAVQRSGGRASVAVLGSDGRTPHRVGVQIGAVGDRTSEVLGGLQAGDRVELPPPAPATSGGS